VLAAVCFMPAVGFAQQPQTVETKAQKASGAAKDPNIRSTSNKNDPAKEVPAPESKGGQPTRGPGPWPCTVQADNWTPWAIQVYVDGYYTGLIGPWGQLNVLTGSGESTFYGRADFTNGLAKTWGVWRFSCPAAGVFNWKLTPG
jgi:hypothetical protein